MYATQDGGEICVTCAQELLDTPVNELLESDVVLGGMTVDYSGDLEPEDDLCENPRCQKPIDVSLDPRGYGVEDDEPWIGSYEEF